MKILVSICARKGSKGLPSKNIHPLLGQPLITHTIEQALAWPKSTKVVVSTNCEKTAEIAKNSGAEVPFLRAEHLATDTIGKMPVLIDAFQRSEEYFKEKFDLLLDLDPTAPIRTPKDLDKGLETFQKSGCAVCFSVTKARKSPYFNMVERDDQGRVVLSKRPAKPFASRQAGHDVWDMNASIYLYSREFLLSNPGSLWDARLEMFEMPPESAFDIDLERDLVIVEALMKHMQK